jgi:hypothetical protein
MVASSPARDVVMTVLDREAKPRIDDLALDRSSSIPDERPDDDHF